MGKNRGAGHKLSVKESSLKEVETKLESERHIGFSQTDRG